MPYWSKCDERTGEYHEGSLGETVCRCCGCLFRQEVSGDDLCDYCRARRRAYGHSR